ncbi:hypothetical protein VFPPC_16297 [Pochonia chlamydosporia 170]|uniref:Uncharacterized protein n=1 Tax=Pochonia chlamydosporia 170 TaxID=1380566 RepID=A0A179FHW3_METCM|nr:hypothetical protein VFPPC_16297 [Pochonia chlamydosporia 170]OAQ65017.1 hypothetical protein VFPPC_16297 [Pochonia chlamydosporia 170]
MSTEHCFWDHSENFTFTVHVCEMYLYMQTFISWIQHHHTIPYHTIPWVPVPFGICPLIVLDPRFCSDGKSPVASVCLPGVLCFQVVKFGSLDTFPIVSSSVQAQG